MKRKKQETLPPLLQLPTDALFIVFTYCEPSDFFYTIPLICNSIRKKLKQQTLAKEKIAQIAQNIANIQAEKDEKNESRISNYIQQKCAVEENRIWKHLCLTQLPSLQLIKDDHFYCYRKLYIQLLPSSKPIFYQATQISQVLSDIETLHKEMKNSIIKLGNKDSEKFYQEHLSKQQQKKKKQKKKKLATPNKTSTKLWEEAKEYHERLVSEKVDSILEEVSNLKKRMETVSQENQEKSRSSVDWKDSIFTEHQEVIDFFKQTQIHSIDEYTDPVEVPCRGDCDWFYNYNMKLVSPVNGNTVKINLFCKLEGFTDDYRNPGTVYTNTRSLNASFFDFTGLKTSEQAWDVNLENQEVVNKMWQVFKHLGLETFCENDHYSKSLLLYRLWKEVIHHTMLTQDCVHEETLDLLALTLTRPKKLWISAYERFKEDYPPVLFYPNLKQKVLPVTPETIEKAWKELPATKKAIYEEKEAEKRNKFNKAMQAFKEELCSLTASLS